MVIVPYNISWPIFILFFIVEGGFEEEGMQLPGAKINEG
jgi:hypothetical protein